MSRTATASAFIEIPAGTKPVECSRCRGKMYWGQLRGRWVMVDCDVPGGEEPSESRDTSQLGMFAGAGQVRDGQGISHWIACPPEGAR